MLYLKKNKLTYNSHRCCQCGVCLSGCPIGALEIYNTPKQYIIKVNLDKCSACGLCVKVCPAHIIHKTHIQSDALEKAHSLLLAYAKDQNVRKYASSGGVTRTLIQRTLEKNIVDSAYTLLYPNACQDEDGNLIKIDQEAEGYWLNTKPELFRIPCSLYRPVLWGASLKRNLPSSGKVLLVGLPCQLKAAKRLLGLIRPKLSVLSIAIFCRKNKNFGYTRYFQKMSGLKDCSINIYKVTYRGNGWPGAVKVLTSMPRKFGYIYPEYCWNLSGCHYCCDCLNMAESDLTVADPWGIVKQDGQHAGQNLVYVWTAEGQKLVEDCSESLVVKQVSVEQALISLDYKAIEQKEMKAQKYVQSRYDLNDYKNMIKARLGEIVFRLRCYRSSFATVNQKKN